MCLTGIKDQIISIILNLPKKLFELFFIYSLASCRAL